jgi:serine/threonine-protein kinase
VSPDGSLVVFRADSGDVSRLFVRRLDAFTSIGLPGSAGAFDPFFSADGRWIGFLADQQLKKVLADGSAPPQVIAPASQFTYASWGDDGSLVHSPDISKGLFRIKADGGVTDTLMSLDRTHGEMGTAFPHLLPGSRAMMYGLLTPTGWKLAARSLDGRRQLVLVEGAMKGAFVEPDQLVYTKGGELYQAGFDPRRLALTGSPRLLEQQLVATDGPSGAKRARDMLAGGAYALFGVSRNGTLAYLSTDGPSQDPVLVMLDRSGARTAMSEGRGDRPRFSINGTRVIAEDSAQAWSLDLSRGGARTRLTSGAPRFIPVPSPDGASVAISSYERGPANLVIVSATGKPEVRLTDSPNRQYVGSWCPDGSCLFYVEIDPRTGADIWRRAALPNGTAAAVVQTEFDEYHPRLSPSGTLLAYTSEQSGRPEVYLLDLSPGGTAERVSTEGGSEPTWRADGRELYYRAGNWLMVLTVGPARPASMGRPRRLVELPRNLENEKISSSYDVSPDGSRFVAATHPPHARPLRLQVVVNGLGGRG